MPIIPVRAQIVFHIMLITILLKFVASFFILYPNFFAIGSVLVIETLSKLHEEEFSDLGKKCESTSDKLHSTL